MKLNSNMNNVEWRLIQARLRLLPANLTIIYATELILPPPECPSASQGIVLMQRCDFPVMLPRRQRPSSDHGLASMRAI